MVAAHGDEETIDQLVNLYRNTTHMEEKRRLLSCLGASEKEECLEKTLKFAMTVSILCLSLLFLVMSAIQKAKLGEYLVHKVGMES